MFERWIVTLAHTSWNTLNPYSNGYDWPMGAIDPDTGILAVVWGLQGGKQLSVFTFVVLFLFSPLGLI